MKMTVTLQLEMILVTSNHDCLHEEQIQGYSQKIAELEAHAEFKEQRINELIKDNKRIERKIDNLTNTVNKVMLNSIRDNNDLKQRVITLETKADTQEKIIAQYEEKARKQREEERAKTNIHLAYIGTAMGVLSFVFAYLLRGLFS